MTETNLDLAESFPGNNREAWEALLVAGQEATPELIAAALGKITKTTIDGINIQPLYDRSFIDKKSTTTESAVFLPSARRGNDVAKPWDIRQIFRNPDPALSNQEILQELAQGTTSVHLVLQQVSPGSGIALQTPEDLSTLLEGVYPELITTAFEPAANAHAAIEWFFQLTQKRNLKQHEICLACNLDPFAGAALATARGKDFSANTDAMLALTKRCATEYPLVTSAAADTRQWHNLGANSVQELAIACALGVHHLKAMLVAGIDFSHAHRQMVFHLAIDADFFTGIAKLRAMRELWAYICQQFLQSEQSAHFGNADKNKQIETGQANIHAHTSQRMLSCLDADNNQLRNTLACSAAAIGGANCISVEAHHSSELHNYPLHQPDEFSRRIARNIQLVLQEESNLHRIVDPMGGSPYIESLTSELVSAAWDEFQQIEKLGGVGAAVSTGALAETIATTQNARLAQLATRKSPLVGVSEFASLEQKAFEPSVDASLKRTSQPFEAMRACSWQFEKKLGRKPTALLLNLGDAKDYQGRAGFSRNFVAAAGLHCAEFESRDLHQANDDHKAQLQKFREALQAAGTSVVIVCSSDSLYAGLDADVFAALRTAGATHVVLAGRSKSLADSSLCDDEIYLGCHAVEKLNLMQLKLGIKVFAADSTGKAS